ncbi:MAG: 7-carboxy-7-deazaguanine synthase QueE, partial [Paramuribaculum sp.]
MYRVNEIFYSLQGEGFFTGSAAVFVRLSGCNRACAFCDTDHRAFTLMTADEIVAIASKYESRFVVVTGGEPLLQLDDALVGALKAAGFFVAVETNGTLPVPQGVDWVTCSPKEKPWN